MLTVSLAVQFSKSLYRLLVYLIQGSFMGEESGTQYILRHSFSISYMSLFSPIIDLSLLIYYGPF